MKKLIKNLPIPISGLMLGTCALGNLMLPYNEIIRWVLGGIALLIFLLIMAKIIFFNKQLRSDLKAPILASVFPTFSMSCMLSATYFAPLSMILAYLFWFTGFFLHIILMILFTKNFVINNFSMDNVFASWFVPYVGIAIAGVSAPVIGMEAIGKIAFWFGLITFIILLPII